MVSGSITDTIVAPATPAGVGAIGIIRLSGAEVRSVGKALYPSLDFDHHKPAKARVKLLYSNHQLIDQTVVTWYKAPASYTGEDVIEIACHGSPYIMQKIIALALQSGARLAKPGEFTQRAYLNKKLDLTQAEAVADLIVAETEASHRIAVQQLRGGVSHDLIGLREKLVDFTALIELELDFSEEDLSFASRDELVALLDTLLDKITELKKTFNYGNAIKKGIPVAIIGKPNVGKSTFLNIILNEERAIVSDVAGTTRDLIEDTKIIDGLSFRFIDTAGLRHTDNLIETLGITKTKEAISKAQLILVLFDPADTMQDQLLEIIDTISDDQKIMIIATKSDLRPTIDLTQYNQLTKQPKVLQPIHSFSKFYPDTLSPIEQAMVAHVQKEVNPNGVIISNSRHVEALARSVYSLQETKEAIQNQLSGEFVAVHLKEAIKNIGEITGHIDIDKDVLNSIFNRFCIGK